MPLDARSFPFELDAIAAGRVPDETIRKVLRFGLSAELRRLDNGGAPSWSDRNARLLDACRAAPFLEGAAAANEQHYEVSPEFFRAVLGQRMKYSCCHWPAGVTGLDEAEEAMLALVGQRADLHDGQDILDLGCGWGALSLHLAALLPASRITALSNSRPQKAWIEARARERGLGNLVVYTGDIAEWDGGAPGTPLPRFDRIVSIEMFEHVRNHEALLAKLAGWLRPQGQLFAQVFSHRRHAYLLQGNWMAERFFTGGMMPSNDWLQHFQRDLEVTGHWLIEGSHYARTARAWLERADAARDAAVMTLGGAHDPAAALRRFIEWRLFFLSCEETFGYAGGTQWMVTQTRFKKHQ
jgi:cyclopropane-fatty-acyl-phospholipid synthase